MKKKGDVEIQFNWIFVIVSGALILAFFVMVVTKQKEISERKLASDILADLDMIITGQAVSPGSSKLLEMSDLELSFTCEDYSIFDVPKGSGNSIIFSPSKIKGAKLIAWTLEWDMPYRAANFIYLTVPEIKYFIIDPAQTAGKDSFGIKSDFPETIDLEVVSNTPLQYEEYQRVRLVYFTGAEPQGSELPMPAEWLKNFKDEDVSVLYIYATDPGDFDGKATMHFFRKKGDSLIKEGLWIAMGKEIVYGAIFSDDYEQYACNMKKALKKLVVVTGVYKERVNATLNGLPPADPCSPYYNEDPFQALIDSISGIDPQGNLLIYPSALYDSIEYIRNLNDRTIFGSCPEIY